MFTLWFSCSGEERGGNLRASRSDVLRDLVCLAINNPADYDSAYIDDEKGDCVWHSDLGYLLDDSTLDAMDQNLKEQGRPEYDTRWAGYNG